MTYVASGRIRPIVQREYRTHGARALQATCVRKALARKYNVE